tara:strand:+ start:817 stop:963 length:147 start_codon:yes stop_codon:yes gene_type:complete
MFEIINQNLYYLDPVSGSFIGQLLIAAGAGVILYIKKIKSFLLNIFKK